MADDDYSFLPYKDLAELKKEMDALKGKKDISTKELYDSVEKLSQTLADMLEVFGAAAEQMKLEEKERDAELKKHESMVSKLDKLLDQNKTIAEGMLAIVDMVKKNIISAKLEKENTFSEQRPTLDEDDSLKMLSPEPEVLEQPIPVVQNPMPRAKPQQPVQSQWQQPQAQKAQSPQQNNWASAQASQQQPQQNPWAPPPQQSSQQPQPQWPAQPQQAPSPMQQNPWQLTPQPEIAANPSFEPPKMDSFGPMFDQMPQMPEPTQPEFPHDFNMKMETGMPSMKPEPAPDLDFPDDNFGIEEPKKRGIMGLFKK